jgi:putative ABC transport system substrate-binding protein
MSTRKRISWLATLLLVVVISALVSGCGAEEPKVYKVGVLAGISFVADITEGFKEGMAELGYKEGENIEYDVQLTDFDMAAYQQALQKFVDEEVDLIFVFPTEATLEAKAVSEETGIPVVFNFAFVEGMGIIDSVREPGGNITGVRYPGPDIALKRFEIMQELVPEATQMIVPYQKGYPIVTPQLEALYPVVEAAGVTLIEVPADNAADLEAQLQALGETGDAILFVAEPLTVAPEPFVVLGKYADEHNIPIGGAFMSVDGYNAVFGLNVNPIESGRDAAPLADKVLKGTQAGTIPVVSADSFLQINYKEAQELGLTVDDGLLSQAAEIVR